MTRDGPEWDLRRTGPWKGCVTTPPRFIYEATLPIARIVDIDLSADGSTVVFINTDKPLGLDLDCSEEIFSLDVATGTLR